MGYGVPAYGCNIGAYFSGIASGSLHGWVWLVAAFVGSIIGTQLRPLFGLSVNIARLSRDKSARVNPPASTRRRHSEDRRGGSKAWCVSRERILTLRPFMRHFPSTQRM